ncbi:MAG TPA: RNA methyltransferase [Bryobacterales bacterium]|nr:RNA methyltransferase [Bryobacterales bacterium]
MARPETISSAANPLVKSVRRAIARGSLTEDGLCVAETFHLLEEALRSECAVKVVLAARSVQSAVEAHVRRLAGIRMAVLSDALFQTISGTESTQGVITLIAPPSWTLEQLFRGRALTIVLDGVQDPGNAGAIVRAAEAFGATGVLFLKGAASPFNPKALRASAGSLFRVPFVHSVDAELAQAAFHQNKLDVYAAVPFTAANHVKSLVDVDFTRKSAVIIGSEGRGVSQTLHADAFSLAIPTVGVESLNAAVAAAVILYEARRQRSLRP